MSTCTINLEKKRSDSPFLVLIKKNDMFWISLKSPKVKVMMGLGPKEEKKPKIVKVSSPRQKAVEQ